MIALILILLSMPSLMASLSAYKTTRNYVLGKCTAFVFSAALLSSPAPSMAQIPSMDDFYTTSGTVIKPKDTVVQPSEDISLSSSVDFKKILTKLEDLSAKELWDDIISIDNKIKKILSSNSDTIVPREVKDDVLFGIGSLNDLSIQNRITYFSKEDLSQISGLIREQDNSDGAVTKNDEAVKEALQIIRDMRKLLD